VQDEQEMVVFSTCGLFQGMIPALTLETLLKSWAIPGWTVS